MLAFNCRQGSMHRVVACSFLTRPRPVLSTLGLATAKHRQTISTAECPRRYRSRLRVAALHGVDSGATKWSGGTNWPVSGRIWRQWNSSLNDGSARVSCELSTPIPGAEVATITISNPNKLNIVDSSILGLLIEECEKLTHRENLRAVVLSGGKTAAGKAPAFIGGADIKEMSQLASADDARAFINRVHHVCTAIRDLPVPVIARVHGYSLGAGVEIMAACDLRIASSASVFAMPEVKVGIPSVVEAALLPGLIGMARTRRLLYLAENINASDAERWGLIDRLVGSEDELDKAVDEWTGRICDMGPNAIRSQKRLMQKWENCSVDEGIAAGVEAYADAYADGGKEPKQYMSKFLKRER